MCTKCTYVDSLTCVKAKVGESECFRSNRDVREGCIMSPWVLNLYIHVVIKEVKMGIGRTGMRFLEEGREWRFSGRPLVSR